MTKAFIKYLAIISAFIFWIETGECLAITGSEIDILLNNAISGDAQAQVKIADILYDAKLYRKALEWYVVASKNGDPYAINKIGNMLYKGEGLKKDLYLAKKFYTAAAQKGNKFAQYNLGNFWYHGQGGEKDLEKARYWLTLSCGNGYNKACNDLAFILKKNKATTLKEEKADEYGTIIDEVKRYLNSLKE